MRAGLGVRTGGSVSRGRGISAAHQPENVIVLLLDGFSLMQMGKLAELFELANQLERDSSAVSGHYNLRLFSSAGGGVRSSSGVQVWTEAINGLGADSVHAMFILGPQDAEMSEPDDQLAVWLSLVHHRARIVKGGGGGGKLLTRAHLNPKDPTAASLTLGATLTPIRTSDGLKLSRDEGDGVFSAALSMVERDMSYKIAQEIVACMMPGMDRKFASVEFGPREAKASESIRTAAHHLRVNSANRISIADAAQAAAMSERNFLRRFKQEIGVTPTEFVLRVRLEKACCMLVESDLPADKVARRTGFGSGDRLAKLFRQHLAMSPTEYRAAVRARMEPMAKADPADFAYWVNGSAS
jgi:transcriptional regulator GlxA family with amidase domain